MGDAACMASGEPVGEASPWVRRFAPLIKRGGKVLDLACGAGRHSRYLATCGYAVLAVDRDVALLDGLRHWATWSAAPIETLQCDLESSPWPFQAGIFAAIVVTNYLHRPLFTPLLAAMRPGGVLIYETFAEGHQHYGRPRNPAFLLGRDELLELIPHNWTVVAFEQGLEDGQSPAVRQRICAVQTMAWPIPLRPPGSAG
jgi:SAM-dependent methyltransferase